jgi:hypothetical protein
MERPKNRKEKTEIKINMSKSQCYYIKHLLRKIELKERKILRAKDIIKWRK